MQPIAYSQFRDEVSRLSRVLFEFVSQLTHVDPKIMRFLDMQRSPDLLEQLPVRKHFSGMPEQRGEEFVLDWRKMNALA